MPAVSQKQRAYLNWHFGHQWVKAHGFDNRGKLPKYARKGKARAKGKRRGRKK